MKAEYATNPDSTGSNSIAVLRACSAPPRLRGSLATSLALVALIALAGCTAREPIPEPVPETRQPMPEVRVEQVAGGEAIAPDAPFETSPLPEAEQAALERGERVSLTAVDTDLRALLAALAEAAGVNLVVGPEVEGRVTVHLQDVRAREALRTVIRESGLMITEPLRAPWGPVVFYTRPVNIDDADASTIQERFGVSAEVADFIVRARRRPPWLDPGEPDADGPGGTDGTGGTNGTNGYPSAPTPGAAIERPSDGAAIDRAAADRAAAERPAPRWVVELEAGPAWQSYNDVEIPNDGSATRFSLYDLAGAGPWPAARLYVTWNLTDRHGVRLLAAPFSLTETGTPGADIDFAGQTYTAGTPVQGTYTFNSYRVSYRYRWHAGETTTAWVGFTAKVRDAVIRLEQGATSSRKTDLGFVPLLHLAGDWRFAPRWRLSLDIDALAGGPGRAEDAALELNWDLDDTWTLQAGYRTVEGGAAVDEVYTFAWLHYATVSVRARVPR